MDVHCTTCGEPWDVYHLWHDAIFETGLSEEEIKYWQVLRWPQKLSERYRQEFRAAGWEFGRSVINVIRCPACPKDAKPNPERLQIKAVLEEMLGADEDGLASTFEEHGI